MQLWIQKTKYIIGHDAFDRNNSCPVFFANNSWYDGQLYYNTEEPPQISDMPEETQEYISETNALIKKLNTVNDYVIESGFYSKYHTPEEESGNSGSESENKTAGTDEETSDSE